MVQVSRVPASGRLPDGRCVGGLAVCHVEERQWKDDATCKDEATYVGPSCGSWSFILWHGRGHGLHRMVIRSSQNRCVWQRRHNSLVWWMICIFYIYSFCVVVYRWLWRIVVQVDPQSIQSFYCLQLISHCISSMGNTMYRLSRIISIVSKMGCRRRSHPSRHSQQLFLDVTTHDT